MQECPIASVQQCARHQQVAPTPHEGNDYAWPCADMTSGIVGSVVERDGAANRGESAASTSAPNTGAFPDAQKRTSKARPLGSPWQHLKHLLCMWTDPFTSTGLCQIHTSSTVRSRPALIRQVSVHMAVLIGATEASRPCWGHQQSFGADDCPWHACPNASAQHDFSSPKTSAGGE